MAKSVPDGNIYLLKAQLNLSPGFYFSQPEHDVFVLYPIDGIVAFAASINLHPRSFTGMHGVLCLAGTLSLLPVPGVFFLFIH